MFMKNKIAQILDGISKRSKRAVLVIFTVALIIRMLLINGYYKNYVPTDGYAYHNIAINIISGSGYSERTEPPFSPFYFREPGYPIFLASIYKIWSNFGNYDYLPYNSDNTQVTGHNEILFAKYIQALIGAISCVVLYLTLKLVLRQKIAFVVSLLFSLYLPFAIYTTILLREILQSLIILSMNFFFAKFLISKGKRYFLLFSLFLAISNLTFQMTKLLPFFALIFIYLYTKDVVYSIKYSFLALLISFMFCLPWICRTYQFFPDIRVAKTFGVSLTHEQLKYFKALQIYKRSGYISSDELYKRLHREWYNLSEKEKFNFSFDGTFEAKTDSIYAQIPKSTVLLQNLKDAVGKLRVSWLHSFWFTKTTEGSPSVVPYQEYLIQKKYILLILSFPGLLFGFLAFIGILLFYKRLIPILLAGTYFVSLFYFIGSEARRMLPVHCFIFMFSCLAIYYIYQKYHKKQSVYYIYKKLFI
ncbi:MAG: hypothetical protein A2163_08180 [Actinobacteria bacterium RBG_13_35_12]|nr:MAG: hypothetical protein A2163_08180 [Actinobacteria bacterium RBG_13_35_12]